MTEIHDIKNNLIGLPFDTFNSLFFICFLVLIILFFSFYSKEKKEKIILEKPKEPTNFNWLISDFEINFFELSKDLFYSKLLWILKLFLEEKMWKSFTKMTFKEIKKINLNKDLESFIEWIYFKEFKKEVEDSKEIRLNLIWEIKKLIFSDNFSQKNKENLW